MLAPLARREHALLAGMGVVRATGLDAGLLARHPAVQLRVPVLD